MPQYETSGRRTYMIDEDGQRILLANFEAIITQETRYIDGATTKSQLTIEGKMRDNKSDEEEDDELPPVKIDTSELSGMAWVMANWGVRCVISPGGNIKEHLRTAIQLNSKPVVTNVYRHIGWTVTGKGPTYIHAGGGITAKGNDTSIKVELPQELSRFDLTPTTTPAEGARAMLALTELGPPGVSWTLLAATLAPMLGAVDFAVHVTGRTGTFKSEVTSLFQSCYGSGMDARHLPGSWSSTANALEAQAFLAKNAPFVVDDFVPSGTSWQQRTYQTTADKLIRSQGNQSGRARLTDTSNLQSTMYPRGLILSTGEDTPEGHSVRARMMIVELSPGDIDVKNLTKCQKLRPLLPSGMAGFAQHLAANPCDITDDVEQVRESCLNIGHTRTPGMTARLLISVKVWTDWLQEIGVLAPNGVARLRQKAEESIMAAANEQQKYLENADPCDMFAAAIRQVFGVGTGHVRTLNGGIPRNPTMLGWVSEGGNNSDVPTYKSRGPCIGWVDWNRNELYLDVNAGYALVKKTGGNEISLTKQTMQKRLKDAGYLSRVDDARQRNTIRVQAEMHPRQVMSLWLNKVMDTQEVASDG